MEQKTLTVPYTSAKGNSLKLKERTDLLVVRTRSRRSLDRTVFEDSTHESLKKASSVASFPMAGVEILDVGNVRSRNKLRRSLENESDIEFAGRVLALEKSGTPVLYTENLFVQFSERLDDSKCRTCIEEFGLAAKRELLFSKNAYFVSAPESTGMKTFAIAKKLLGDSRVEVCHPELIMERRAKQAFPEQWHLKATTINGQQVNQHANVEKAWEMSVGTGTVIAVIDDGQDVEHEEFSGPDKIVAPRDVSYDRDSADPGPLDNHGTACAGVACASGEFGASGVAPDAQLMPIRLVTGLGSIDEAEAFYHAAVHGADVISCSWGPPDGDWSDPDDPTHEEEFPLPASTRLAIEYAIQNGRDGKGCVIAWAGGNGREPVENDGYASHPDVIAVAACNDRGTRSVYSDSGDAIWCAFPSDDREDPITPGIWTTDRSGRYGYNFGDPRFGDALGNYANDFGGTSSSAPGVAGVAALLLSVNPGLRHDQVKEIIKDTCDQIDTTNGEYDKKGHSPFYGYGRVNAVKAVANALALGGEPRPAKPPRDKLCTPYLPEAMGIQEEPLDAWKDFFQCQARVLESQNELLKLLISGAADEDQFFGDEMAFESLEIQGTERFLGGLFGGTRRRRIPISRRLTLRQVFAALVELMSDDFNRSSGSIRTDTPLVGRPVAGQPNPPIAGSARIMASYVNGRVSNHFNCRPRLAYPAGGFTTVGELARAIFANRNAQ